MREKQPRQELKTAATIVQEDGEDDQVKPKRPFLKSGGGKNAMMMK